MLSASQFSGEGGLVDGLVPLEQGHRRIEAELVPLPVEVSLLQQGGYPGDAFSIDQERPDERLFGFDVVRQKSFGVERQGYSSASAVT